MSRKLEKEDFIVASQIWAVLVWAAKNRQILHYKHLSPLVNRHWEGDPLSLPLGLIKQYCKKHRLPALTVLVVDSITGRPRPGLDDVPNPAQETVKVYKRVDKEWRIFWDSGKSTNSNSKIFNPGVEEFAKLRF